MNLLRDQAFKLAEWESERAGVIAACQCPDDSGSCDFCQLAEEIYNGLTKLSVDELGMFATPGDLLNKACGWSTP